MEGANGLTGANGESLFGMNLPVWQLALLAAAAALVLCCFAFFVFYATRKRQPRARMVELKDEVQTCRDGAWSNVNMSSQPPGARQVVESRLLGTDAKSKKPAKSVKAKSVKAKESALRAEEYNQHSVLTTQL